MKSENRKLLEKYASKGSSGILETIDAVEKSESWYEISARVAFAVLAALKAKNWTQKDLAEKMGVSAQRVNTIVSGKENLTLATIEILQGALNIQIVLPEELKKRLIVTPECTTTVKEYRPSNYGVHSYFSFSVQRVSKMFKTQGLDRQYSLEEQPDSEYCLMSA